MNLSKVEKLISLLRKSNVSHFKTHEVEVSFHLQPTSSSHVPATPPCVSPPTPDLEDSNKRETPLPKTAASVPPSEMKIPHFPNEVVNLLKMSDNDLVEAIFPLPKDPAQL